MQEKANRFFMILSFQPLYCKKGKKHVFFRELVTIISYPDATLIIVGVTHEMSLRIFSHLL